MQSRENRAHFLARRHVLISAFAPQCEHVRGPWIIPLPSPQDMVCKNVRSAHEEYEFEQVIGKGSFGQVHRAVHLRTGVHRAVKDSLPAGL